MLLTNITMQLRDNYKYTHISTQTTTVVSTVPCVLIRIIVGSTAAGTVTVVDNNTGSTPVVGVLKTSIVEGTYEFGIQLVTGLSIITGAASDLTIVTAGAPF